MPGIVLGTEDKAVTKQSEVPAYTELSSVWGWGRDKISSIGSESLIRAHGVRGTAGVGICANGKKKR